MDKRVLHVAQGQRMVVCEHPTHDIEYVCIVEDEAVLEAVFYIVMNGMQKQHVQITIMGQGRYSRSSFTVRARLSDAAHFTCTTEQRASADYATMEGSIKVLVSDSAVCEHTGMIMIVPQVRGVVADLQAQALVCSEFARAYLTPALEVLSHDVACAHGAAVGYVEKDMLWYLMSRGISYEDAQKLIQEGFLHEGTSAICVCAQHTS